MRRHPRGRSELPGEEVSPRRQDPVQRAHADRVRTEGHARARDAGVPANGNDLVSAAAFIDASRDAVWGGTEYDRAYMEDVTPPGTPSQITYGLAERIRILADDIAEARDERDAARAKADLIAQDANAAIGMCVNLLQLGASATVALTQKLHETTLQRDAFRDEVRYWKGEGADTPERLDPAGLELFMRDLCEEVEAAVRDGREVNFGVDIEFVFVEGGTQGLPIEQFGDVALLLKSINPSGTRVA